MVANALKEALGDEYRIYNDITLLRGDFTMQIDHLVISPYGVFVIETKDYKGKITNNDDKKFIQSFGNKSFTLNNPALQNSAHIRGLTRIIGEQSFHNLVCFGNRCTLDLRNIDTFIGKIDDIIAYIKSKTQRSTTDGEIAEIINKLNSATVPPEKAKQLHLEKIEWLKKRKYRKSK